ncbi:MAG: tRNA lysidine(34) synthetase TilS [Oscillospiraceae bacterium]|nr:tRNA lysidine(34) synthetase TilS [Oscillospiraceae bacterium]
MMLNKIRNTIKKYGLIEKGDGILIGLSGGADSVCLTHALYRLQDELEIHLYTAHMNHCLRGDNADADERFAVEFSESLGINCLTKHESVRDYARENGMSEEMAGRELRYAFFERIRKSLGLNKIATAHNKNDNAETILMNFMRGSGISGLCGIPVTRGKIIRPIIDLSRDEIENYCRENNLEYVTDSTNSEMIYTRNKVRLDLIPKIQNEFNNNFIANVTKNAELISDELDFIESAADRICGKIEENTIALKMLDVHIALKRRVILTMLRSAGIKDIEAEYIESVLRLAESGRSGASINLPNGNIAKIEYGKLYIGADEDKTPPFEYTIPINCEVYIKELKLTVFAEIVDASDGGEVFKGDADSKITVRNRRSGDFFYPAGMDGRKKIKDYFIDCKVPRAQRDRTGILTIDGNIAWIIGRRRDKRFFPDGKGIRIKLLK